MQGAGEVCWILEGLVVDSGSGGVFAGKKNLLNLPGKCKPEDESGWCVVTSMILVLAVLLCQLCSS